MQFRFVLSLLIFLASCSSRQKVDMLISNARIYTVDSSFSIAESMAIKDGKIVAVGTTDSLKQLFEASDTLDAKGRFIYPGLIDAHTHFFRYAMGLQRVDLVGTTSWDEILQKLREFATKNKEGWLIGRGWDQNDWPVKEFPTKERLDEMFPERPVFLTRVDGHAAIANQAALDLGGVKAGDAIAGGEIKVKNGKLAGVLVDNAVILVASKIPEPEQNRAVALLKDAQNNCFAAGLTTVDDCGLDYKQVMAIDSLQKNGTLKMRVYALLSDAKQNFDFLFAKGKIKTDRLSVQAFKVYADGALGSRGACLLEPYTDQPGHEGFLLNTPAHFDSVAKIIYDHDFQMCTHAIGDSANRAILNIYAKYLNGKNDRRWRIEHAQVINERDFALFGLNSIIPSVQPTHATSDMYWASQRLGDERVKGAYAYRQLMQQNNWLPLGTDFPVEDISPLKTFYAATIRQDAKGWPASGFQPENALERKDALKGMTIWAARSNFEEQEKGSLEKGKLADFVMLDQDLLTASPDQLLKTQVLLTVLNGEKSLPKEIITSMGEAELISDQRVITIHSNIIVYGKAASEALANMMREEIETMWNEPQGKIHLGNEAFTIRFKIDSQYLPNIDMDEVYMNTDPRNNYFRIEEFASTNISFVDGLGCNTGYFLLENLYAGSTTAAHEYGHTLGLDHPYDIDYRGQGAPGIMYPRGTLVDPQFQYDPAVPAGVKGGTLYPIHRKVLQSDIQDLRIHRLRFKGSKAVLGDFTNIFHFDHREE